MTQDFTMTSSRPYLVRALYEWILDNGLTPYLLVDATVPGAVVPRDFVQDGKIVLNISPSAVRDLELGNDQIHFNARFRGVAQDVFVPVGAVLAIYARENGHGMVFAEEGDTTPPPSGPTRGGGEEKKGGDRPHLRVVK